MSQHHVTIKSIHQITHDVLKIVTDKPHKSTFSEKYIFTPGQATKVSINKTGWEKAKRPFTFTCLPKDDYLEFITKTYPEKEGVTNQLRELKKGDELILQDPYGTIEYKGEGVFIAGGAGITPFISILRYLGSRNELGNNKLIFANKTKGDIILEEEFKKLLGKNFINILSDDHTKGYAHGKITEDFLTRHNSGFFKYYYVCGPPLMMKSVEKQLKNMKVNDELIITETF